MTSVRVAGARFAAGAVVGLFAAFLITVKAGVFYLPVAVGLVCVFGIVAVAFWGSLGDILEELFRPRNRG